MDREVPPAMGGTLRRVEKKNVVEELKRKEKVDGHKKEVSLPQENRSTTVERKSERELVLTRTSTARRA